MSGIFSGNGNVDSRQCFVMMPFAESFNAIYRLIHRCCEEQGLTCIRADEDAVPGKITGKIYRFVEESGIIIADMTGKNPNVFYELGLAHAISGNVILLTQSKDDVPFDLLDFMYILYNNTIDGSEKLAGELSKVLTTILRSAENSVSNSQDIMRNNTEPSDDLNVDDVDTIDLGLFHLKAEISRNHGDMNKAREWLQKAFQHASSGHGDAAEIGNCAIEAEKCRFFNLAENLYRIAVSRDADHVNNRQCYVSFMLDNRPSEEKLKLCGDMLDSLETTLERRERTRALRAQYLTISQQRSGGAVNYDEIISDILGSDGSLSIHQAAPLLSALQTAKQYDKFRYIVERVRANASKAGGVQLDRILADCLADSGNTKYEDEAIAIYRHLIDAGDDDGTDIKHNLATLIYSKDRNDITGEAGKLWRESYSANPNDKVVSKSFARYLMRRGNEEEAAAVLENKTIDL